jgi:protease IV
MKRLLSLTLAALFTLAAIAQAKPATAPAKDETRKESKAKSAEAEALAAEVRKADSKPGGAVRNKVLAVTLSGSVRERALPISLLSRRTESLKDYIDLMRRAREDADVSAVVLRLSEFDMGLAMAQELRLAIGEVRAKGKKVHAVLESDSQVAYLIATACDDITLPPSGDVMLTGAKAESYFLKSLLAKFGVSASVVHIGKYKSAGEMFSEDSFTTPARENMTEIVDDIYSLLVGTVAESRKLDRAAVEAIVNAGPAGAPKALEAKLVDRVAYADEVLDGLKKDGTSVVEAADYMKDGSEKLDELNPLGLILGMSGIGGKAAAPERTSKYPMVAVVYAVGPITQGSSDSMLGSDEEIASDDFIQMLDEIEKDKKIKAVILRVNSPGGSAFASDLIWQKLQELKKSKPIVVSMSDVAASGGYYIAMGANKIVALPGTLTGSIGVIGGKLNLSGGFDKIGLRKETISRGDMATLFSETSDFSPKERELVEAMMRRTYDEFTSKAAEGRRMTKDEVEAVAQGRVWSGMRAKEQRLVDETGGMGKAIEETKNLLGMGKNEKVALVAYPKEVGLMDMLRKAIGAGAVAQVSLRSDPMLGALPESVQRVLMTGRSIARMLERERVLAVMPFVPSVR